MKQRLLLCAFLFSTSFLLAQNTQPPIIWTSGILTNQVGFVENGIEIYDLTVGDGVYLAINCSLNSTFPNGQVITVGTDESTLVLVKYDFNSGIEWIKNLGFVGTLQNGVKISAHESGLYVTGSFAVPTINFGNGVTVTQNCTQDCEEIFVAKFNSNGTAAWANTIRGDDDSFLSATGIQLDGTGKIYLSGNYFNSTTLNFGAGVVYSSLPNAGFFLAQMQSNTGVTQVANFPSPTTPGGASSLLAVNQNGQTVLCGTFSNSITLPGGLTLNTNLDYSQYVAGLDANGLAIWGKVISSNDYVDILGLDIDETGRAYLALDASGDLLLDGGSILSVNSTYAGLVLALDANFFEIPLFIEYDSDGYLVTDVAYSTMSSTLYTAGYDTEAVNLGGETLPIGGCVDGFIGIASPFSAQTGRTVGGAGCEGFSNDYQGSIMDIDEDGFLYIAGLFVNGFSEDGFSLPLSGVNVTKFYTSTSNTQSPANPLPFQISPNPSAGQCQITLAEAPSEAIQLRIHDVNGRLVWAQNLVEKQTNLTLDLPNGAYFIALDNGREIARQKWMVVR